MDSKRLVELAALANEASGCTKCALAETRTQVVFASGHPNAPLMIVGEAPGQNEDEQGLPFVGRSGDLLDELMEMIGLDRKNVYITNVVKCRPPKNRDPKPEEIEACTPYLRDQVPLVDPQVVVTLGNFATKLLLPTEEGISKVRGRSYEWWARWLVPTYHPAAALRGGPKVKDLMQADFWEVRRLLDSVQPTKAILD